MANTTTTDQPDLHRPFVVGGANDDDGGGVVGGEHVGSTTTTRYCNGGATNDVVFGGAAGHEINFAASSSSSNNTTTNNLHHQQPFDIFAAANAYPNTTSTTTSTTTTTYVYKSPEEGYYPTFTSAQWKELERQAMIYKHMVSSVPVPNNLLFPLSSRPFITHDPTLYRYSTSSLSKNGGDPEPGRCKRTDGKKWRCSRDVSPHQKYCERHLHRGRPRSRKPVEIPPPTKPTTTNKKTRIEPVSIPKSNAYTTTTCPQFVPDTNDQLMLFNAKSDVIISSANRDMSLMMETENRWHQFVEPSMGFSNQGTSIYGSNTPIYHQDYIQNQPLNVYSYPTYPPAPEIEAPIGFIDAWSIDNLNNTNNANPNSSLSPNDESLSTSLNLSMAMAAGNVLDDEMGNDYKNCGDDDDAVHSAKDSRWLCPVSWEPFARGGPLAEALQPGSAAATCTNLGPLSPHDSISNTPTTVSSPSGVIQRTLFSNSDGSVCNSPTVPSEVVFQWLN